MSEPQLEDFWGSLLGQAVTLGQDAVGMWERWVLPLLTGALDWVWKGSYRSAWAVPCGSSSSCSHSYGRGPGCVEGYRTLFDALVC